MYESDIPIIEALGERKARIVTIICFVVCLVVFVGTLLIQLLILKKEIAEHSTWWLITLRVVNLIFWGISLVFGLVAIFMGVIFIARSQFIRNSKINKRMERIEDDQRKKEGIKILAALHSIGLEARIIHHPQR